MLPGQFIKEGSQNKKQEVCWMSHFRASSTSLSYMAQNHLLRDAGAYGELASTPSLADMPIHQPDKHGFSVETPFSDNLCCGKLAVDAN